MYNYIILIKIHPPHVETRDGGQSKTSITSKHGREVWGWVQGPQSCISTWGTIGGVVKTPTSRRNARGRCGGGYKVPHLAFQHEGTGGQSKHFHRVKTRGGCGDGYQSPPSCFSMWGWVGGWLKHPHCIETQEGCGDGVPEPPVLLFDAREGLVVVLESPVRSGYLPFSALTVTETG